MMASKVLLNLVLIQACLNDDWLKQNLKLSSLQQFVANQNYVGTTLYLPTSKDSLDFVFDLNYDEVLVADKGKYKFGTVCDAANKDCEVTDQKANGYFQNHEYNGVWGTLSLVPAKDQAAPVSKAKFVWVQDRLDWIPDKWNSIGLGPQSSFISHLKQNNGGKPFGLSFNNEISQGENRFFQMKTQVTINQTFDNQKPIYQKSYTSPDKWLIELGATWEDFKIDSQDACIVQYDPNILLLTQDQFNDLSKKVFQKLCGKDTCTKDEGSLEKMPNFVFQLQGVSLEFLPREYLFLEDNTYVLRMGISSQVQDFICRNRPFLLGGYGFGRLNINLTIDGDRVDVKFYTVNPPPTPSHKLRTFIIVFLLILIILGVAALAYYFLVVKKQQEGNRNFQNEELIA